MSPGRETHDGGASGSDERSEEFRQRHAEGGGEPLDVDEAEVLLAPLDAANVGAVQARPVGKLLLRPAPVVAESPDACPEPCADVVHRGEFRMGASFASTGDR